MAIPHLPSITVSPHRLSPQILHDPLEKPLQSIATLVLLTAPTLVLPPKAPPFSTVPGTLPGLADLRLLS